MRLLDDSHWVARTYDLIDSDTSEMLEDVAVVKHTLVEAVARSHLEHTGSVPDEKKASALQFLTPFHNVFTTNYDLLLYWVNMHAVEKPPYEDGFRNDPDDPESPYLVFSERIGDGKGLFYLHGALHLYLAGGQLRKHSWVRTGRRLTDLIQEGLNKKEYPLFVAEGSPEKKLDQINRNGYLGYCLGKLGRVKSRLVVYGHALGDTDRHINWTIADNLAFKEMYVGLHGDPNSDVNRGTQTAVEEILQRRAVHNQSTRKQHPLDVGYFASETAQVWGD